MIAVRNYREDDEASVVAVIRDLQRHEGQYFDRLKPAEEVGPWYVGVLQKELALARGVLLVAEFDGRVVGYASLFLDQASDSSKEEIPYSYSCVGDLGVLHDCRGRGVGTALMDRCEQLARDHGAKWLRLGVLAGNESARRFYRGRGLRELFVTLENTLS